MSVLLDTHIWVWWLTPASFHGDPADRLIVATACTYAMPLATHDAAIRRSRAVKFWRP